MEAAHNVRTAAGSARSDGAAARGAPAATPTRARLSRTRATSSRTSIFAVCACSTSRTRVGSSNSTVPHEDLGNRRPLTPPCRGRPRHDARRLGAGRPVGSQTFPVALVDRNVYVYWIYSCKSRINVYGPPAATPAATAPSGLDGRPVVEYSRSNRADTFEMLRALQTQFLWQEP